jgi:hypothetical protein
VDLFTVLPPFASVVLVIPGLFEKDSNRQSDELIEVVIGGLDLVVSIFFGSHNLPNVEPTFSFDLVGLSD